MDELIKRFDCELDLDLAIVPHRGIAYQRNQADLVEYGQDYFNMCLDYEDKEIALKINAGRSDFVRDFTQMEVLDIGIGSGEFIKKFENAVGYDINPTALKWLRENDKFQPNFEKMTAFTMWDVLEHVPEPAQYFKQMQSDSYLFVSMPIFTDLTKIRESKHYRPNEHLYYFTAKGFKGYMALHGFRLIGQDDFETNAGRESIHSFAFKKDLATYHDNLSQYKELHNGFYGSSSMLHFDEISSVVLEQKPKSILDYGCGRSDLVAHFWNDGKREIDRYDPAIPAYKTLKDKTYDMVLCNDVLEHIEMRDVDRVLQEIKTKSDSVIFTISLKLARAVLPDGRNAHVTILKRKEWLRWIKEVFGAVLELESKWEHILICRVGK